MRQNYNTYHAQYQTGMSTRPVHTKKPAYSWTLVITLLILFFPVGIFLLYKRFTYDLTAVSRNVKGLRNSAIVFFCLAGLYLSIMLSGELSMISAVLFFGILGLVFLMASLNMKRKAERYHSYIVAIINQKQRSIDVIASLVGVNQQTAQADLQKMIESGYFPGSYLDVISGNIVLPEQPNSFTAAKPTTTKVVICKGCGANNTVVVGEARECEYCGSPIE